jgi:putative endonuclease
MWFGRGRAHQKIIYLRSQIAMGLLASSLMKLALQHSIPTGTTTRFALHCSSRSALRQDIPVTLQQQTIMADYYVYILASPARTLYTGVTNDLERRIRQHRTGQSEFAARYNITRLVHYEVTNSVVSAIAREKEIEGWRREKKIALIEQDNPTWNDLAADW